MKDSKKPDWQKALADQSKAKYAQGGQLPTVTHLVGGLEVSHLAADTCPNCPKPPVPSPPTTTVKNTQWGPVVSHHDGAGGVWEHPNGITCPKCDAADMLHIADEMSFGPGPWGIPSHNPVTCPLCNGTKIGDIKSAEMVGSSFDVTATVNEHAALAAILPGYTVHTVTTSAHTSGPSANATIQVWPPTYHKEPTYGGPPAVHGYADSLELLRQAIPALGEYDALDYADVASGQIVDDCLNPVTGIYRRYRHRADCPVTGCTARDRALGELIIHLNDTHHWPRAAVDTNDAYRHRQIRDTRYELDALRTSKDQRPTVRLPIDERIEKLTQRLAELTDPAKPLNTIADWLDEYAARTGVDLSFRSPDGPDG